MTSTLIDYHALAEASATSYLGVFYLCQQGRVQEAQSALNRSNTPEGWLAAGIVEYWLASAGHGSHERAKDTLTRAWEKLEGEERLFAQVFLGLCYSRQGDPQNASVMIDGAADESRSGLTKFVAVLSSAILDLEQELWRRAEKKLQTIRPLTESQVDGLRGKFYMQSAVVHQLAGRADKAISEYDLAAECFERCGHEAFLARVLNNLGHLYITINIEQAHYNITPAISILERLGDKLELAQARDTQASIYLHEGDLVAAKRSADAAINLLVNDQQLWLSKFLTTRGCIFTAMNRNLEAMEDFQRAAEHAETMGDSAAVMRVHRTALTALTSAPQDLSDTYHYLCRRLNGEIENPSANSLEEFKAIERRKEKERIRLALVEAQGSARRAAKILGLARNTLSYKIEKHHSDLSSLLKTKRRSVFTK